MTISTIPSPSPSVPAPGWTPDDKEKGRVDTLLALEDGRCFVGGNFGNVAVNGTALQRQFLATFKGATVGALTPRIAARAYGLAHTPHMLHVAGHGGYDVFHKGDWHSVLSIPLRAISVLDEKVYVGEEFGSVRQVDGWRVVVGSSVRTVIATETAVYAGSYDSKSHGTITKLSPLSGRKLAWTDATAKGPVLDMALSPDQQTLYAAIGGPGGTVAAYDTRTGKRTWFFMTDGNCQAVCTLADGTVVVGMHGDNVASGPNKTIAEYGTGGRVGRKKVFSLTPRGTLLTWQVDLSSREGVLGVWALTASSSMLYVGGDFTHINGVEHPRFASFAVS